MPIAFDCSCGKTLRVPDEHAGRRAKCPACNAVVSVPLPEPTFEIVEPLKPSGKPVAKPVVDDDDSGVYGLAEGGGNSGSDDDESDAPRPKKRLPNFRKGRDNRR